MTGREEGLQWREISMRIENIEDVHVSVWSSVMILNKALYNQRSTNQFKAEEGFRKYEKQKREIIKRRESREALADRLYTFIEITVYHSLRILNDSVPHSTNMVMARVWAEVHLDTSFADEIARFVLRLKKICLHES
ncbi:hypothetical protein NC652_028463 [Populus alba x Populus x berolinensis]|uniref:Uncharacterized protein n=1 Tax=Populus alba x Populus x berolinensis TaxID=444605 RepID=A0AAD6Q5Y5_9ROSI|nr:hypothetical protein NC652_028463 [Populus alba x Populus x berolinensis]KAJ6980349.1 hypothetical protein NC653_028225 [Populus alba x Populus x berolinensis]